MSADPEALVRCPYDSKHLMRNKRIQIHLINCRKNNPEACKNMQKCPFNAKHIVPKLELKYHTMTCRDRAAVDREILHDTMAKTDHLFQQRLVPVINHNIHSDENWDQEIEESRPAPHVGLRQQEDKECDNPPPVPDYPDLKPGFVIPAGRTKAVGRGAPGITAPILPPGGRGVPMSNLPPGGRGTVISLTPVIPGRAASLVSYGSICAPASRGHGAPPVSSSVHSMSIGTAPGATTCSSVSVSTVSHPFSGIVGVGRGRGSLIPPPSPPSIASQPPLVSIISRTLTGKPTIETKSCCVPVGHQLSDAEQCRREERKLRKKLKEILKLQHDHLSGEQLNEDQLRKISLIGDVEQRLRILSMC